MKQQLAQLAFKEPYFTMQRLFVYSTLAPGQANYKMVVDVPGLWESAMLKEILIQKRWGAEMGCPGIIPAEGAAKDGDEVEGFVFISAHLAEHWLMLDEFEFEGYKRVLATVRVNGTHEVEAYVAYVYALNRDA